MLKLIGPPVEHQPESFPVRPEISETPRNRIPHSSLVFLLIAAGVSILCRYSLSGLVYDIQYRVAPTVAIAYWFAGTICLLSLMTAFGCCTQRQEGDRLVKRTTIGAVVLPLLWDPDPWLSWLHSSSPIAWRFSTSLLVLLVSLYLLPTGLILQQRWKSVLVFPAWLVLGGYVLGRGFALNPITEAISFRETCLWWTLAQCAGSWHFLRRAGHHWTVMASAVVCGLVPPALFVFVVFFDHMVHSFVFGSLAYTVLSLWILALLAPCFMVSYLIHRRRTARANTRLSQALGNAARLSLGCLAALTSCEIGLRFVEARRLESLSSVWPELSPGNANEFAILSIGGSTANGAPYKKISTPILIANRLRTELPDREVIVENLA